MKKLFFLSLVSFIAGCGVSSKPSKEIVVETVIEIQPEVEISPDLKDSVYNFGYKKGYKNFMKQMGLDDDEKTSYTSSTVEDESILEKEEYQDIMMKGYVDGYHKAGESMNLECPRN